MIQIVLKKSKGEEEVGMKVRGGIGSGNVDSEVAGSKIRKTRKTENPGDPFLECPRVKLLLKF